MKLESVKKELKEMFRNSLLTTEEWKALVEESETNKELEAKMEELQSQFNSITGEAYEEGDFATSVKTLNGAVDFVEVLRGWDIVEKIREYQDIFKMGYTFKDEYFVSPIPLVLVSLDPERILMKQPEKWYENNKETFVKLLDKLIMRENLKGDESDKKAIKEPLNGFIGRHSLEKYPKILCYFMQKHEVFPREEGFDKILKSYQEYISKKYDKLILEHNPNLKKITYASMVKDYFGLVLDESHNAPKLAKQLKKAGISYTDKEIQHFGEVKNWWEDWNYKNFSTMENNLFRVRDLWVDYADFEIPTLVDKWAFNGSCNKLDSGTGSDTHLVLKYFGFNYLKGYSTIINNGEVSLCPSMRTYYYKNSEGELGHAGTYADFGGTRAKACYEFTTTLLCIVFNRKIDEFSKINGMDIPCDNYRDKNRNYINFWANQAQNDYAKWGTADVFSEFNYSNIEEYVNNHLSLKYTVHKELTSSEYLALISIHTRYYEYVLKKGHKEKGHKVLEALKELLKTE